MTFKKSSSTPLDCFYSLTRQYPGISPSKPNYIRKFIDFLTGKWWKQQEESETLSPTQDSALQERMLYRYLISSTNTDYKYITFTMSFIAIAMQLAKTDGQLNKEELSTISEIFRKNGTYQAKIKEIVRSAYHDQTEWKIYVTKITTLFPGETKLYRDLVDWLIKVALADGYLTTFEMHLFKQIIQVFYIAEKEFMLMLKSHLIESEYESEDPYLVLGINEDASLAQLNKAYADIVRSYHPDVLTGYANVAPEYIKIMATKFTAANSAYMLIKKKYALLKIAKS
jgi:DnaJ like chaperone protein